MLSEVEYFQYKKQGKGRPCMLATRSLDLATQLKILSPEQML